MTSEFTRQRFFDHFDVSRETQRSFDLYLDCLQRWNPRINLVSKTTLADTWHRHFADSAQLYPLIPQNTAHWLDIGVGAGFPGLVIAMIARDKMPSLRVTLVESDQRKCAFLRDVARQTETPVTVLSERIETLKPQNADILSARALSDLANLMEFAEQHRKKSGICLLLKGRTAANELTRAGEDWHMEASVLPSLTDSEASVVKIGAFHRVKRSS